MNSVMDDNKLLTLINGDRIRLERFCKMLFEVADLQYASPATISRCGMVYVDPRNLGFEPFWHKWMIRWTKSKEKYETLIDALNELYPKYIPPLMARIFDGVEREETFKPLDFAFPRTNLNVIQQLTRLLDAMLDVEGNQDADVIECTFIYAIVWSLGACLTNESKKVFEELLKKVAGRHVPTPVFDFYYDYNKSAPPAIRNWSNWDKHDLKYVPPPDGKFSKILVPTVDTKRFSFLLSLMVKEKYPCMFVGESGTAKSVIISNYLASLPSDNYMRLNINFSSRTASLDLQTTIEDNIDKRSGRVFGPKILGKKLIIFIDDLHMPKVDTYGTQQPIALLKFLIERGYLYERGGNLDMKIIKETQYVSALLPPSVATMVDPRLLSLYTTFNLMFPSHENLQRIYNSILKTHVAPFPPEITECVEKITECTLKLYKQIVDQLPRTPVKFHYIFNLRDLSRIYEGLTRSTVDKFTTKEQFVRLWRNECTRVFSDRLITEEDRKLVCEKMIPDLIKSSFDDCSEYAMKEPLLFGDYMTAQPAELDYADPRLYEDCKDFEMVKAKFDRLLADYNDDEKMKEMNLVLFNDALEHLTKIHRIIRFPRGHALLVGYGGSGKQSLTRLSAYAAGYKIFMIQLTRGYKEKEFR